MEEDRKTLLRRFYEEVSADKRIEIGGFDMLRFREGRITEHWGLMDAMTMMQQLGAIPEQAPA